MIGIWRSLRPDTAADAVHRGFRGDAAESGSHEGNAHTALNQSPGELPNCRFSLINRSPSFARIHRRLSDKYWELWSCRRKQSKGSLACFEPRRNIGVPPTLESLLNESHEIPCARWRRSALHRKRRARVGGFRRTRARPPRRYSRRRAAAGTARRFARARADRRPPPHAGACRP